jgi:hypothetical protein
LHLFEIIFGGRPPALSIPGDQLRPSLGILVQLHPYDLCKDLLGEIIERRAKASGADDEVGAPQGFGTQGLEIVAIIPNTSLAMEGQAQSGEAFAHPNRIGVEAAGGEEFSADGEAFNAHETS